MANIMDYLDWRGDISLDVSPFNDIDALILTEIAYVKLSGIAPRFNEEPMTLKEVSDLFFATYTQEELDQDKSFVNETPYLMQKAAETRRFGQAEIRYFDDCIDIEEEVQFVAMEIITDDGVGFVAYQGTDDTIVGWKEDFNLSYKPIPSQQYAIDYLKRVMFQPHDIRVGGHSKGSHLAVYASSCLERRLQPYIERVYAFDGPGFTVEFLNSDGYVAISDRISRFVPETSIIGLLLEHDITPKVVLSKEKGVMQHNGLTWQLKGTSFLYAEAISPLAAMFDDVCKDWVNSIDVEGRKIFVDDVFSLLEVTGLTTLTELQNEGWKHSRQILERLNQMNSKTRKITELLVKILWGQWWDNLPSLIRR